MNYGVGSAGSQYFSVRGVRRDRYRVYLSDERRRNEENWPRPEGLRRKSGAPSDRSSSLGWRSGHISFSPSTVDPPQPSGSASSGRICARNAAHSIVHSRLQLVVIYLSGWITFIA
jgi:hypothetical protein